MFLWGRTNFFMTTIKRVQNVFQKIHYHLFDGNKTKILLVYMLVIYKLSRKYTYILWRDEIN